MALLLKLLNGRLRFCALWSQAIRGQPIVGWDYRKSSCHKSSYHGSNHCWLSRQKFSIDEMRDRYGPWVSDYPSSHLWLSFLRTVSGPRRNSHYDELCTHIWPFIRTSVHLAGSSRIMARPSTFVLLLQDICCIVTLLPRRPGGSWYWCPKSQTWLRATSHLSYHFTCDSPSGFLL